MRNLVTLLVALAAGCKVGLSVPDKAKINCVTSADCPADFTCHPVSAVCVPTVSLAPGCGNGVIDAGEVCDDGNTVSGDRCSADCSSLEVCGNGITDLAAREECDCGDGSTTAPAGCSGPNSLAVAAECRPDCRRPGCGDGVIVAPEQCESANLGGVTCAVLGYDGGVLACSPQCRFDVSGCLGYCGDGIVQESRGEICETVPPPTLTCLDFGFSGGMLSCASYCGPAFPSCMREGSRIIADYPSFAYFFDIWGSASNDIYAVGEEGLFHWNGAEITQVYGDPFAISFQGVWGSRADDVFAVGQGGTVVRFDGNGWQLMSIPTSQFLWAVWGSSASDVWAVGDDGIFHYNGSNWQLVDGTTGLRDIHGSGPDDVWAVGNGGAVVHRGADHLWTPIEGLTGTLWSVWSFGPTDALVGSVTKISHYSAGGWTNDTSAYALSLWASGPNAIDAGGSGEMFHWDGISWAQRHTANTLDTVRLWGNGGALYGVGGENAITRSDGLTITQQGVSGVTATLRDVWGDSAFAVAVGDTGTILHWKNGAWTSVGYGGSQNLRAVWGIASNDVWAVGSGTVLHWTGGPSWNTVTNPGGNFSGVWGTASNDLYVSLSDLTTNFVLHYDGSWAQIPVGATSGWDAVWGSGASDIYLAGHVNQTPVMRHYGAAGWGSSPLPGGTKVHGGGGAVASLFAGSPSHMSRFAAGTATDISPPQAGLGSVTASPNDVLMTGPGDVLAVGDLGSITHFDGTTWWPLQSGTSATLNAIGGAAGTWFAVGAAGTIIRITRDIATGACSQAKAESLCNDGVDNDCDFLVDGADPDCHEDGVCWGAVVLQCGQTLTRTFGRGATTIRNAGCTPVLHAGPEDTFRLTPPTTGSVTVTLSDASADVDLVAVGATSVGACDPAALCLAASNNPGNQVETVTVPVTAAIPVFFVVDATATANTTYRIGVACQ